MVKDAKSFREIFYTPKPNTAVRWWEIVLQQGIADGVLSRNGVDYGSDWLSEYGLARPVGCKHSMIGCLYFGWLVWERKIEHFPAAWLHACKSGAHGYRNTLLAYMCRCMQPIGFFTSKRDGDACCGPGWRKPGSVVRAWPNGETNQSDPICT